ncbi:phage baseplate protein [Acetobacter pasteurianus]|uniref:Uncharacterized protein n=2 Tax=Acetobacter pasteurianus TaxID=438 RepID=A0AAC9SPS8_ACEPA|nr:hypothetical protein S101468_00920 [Acetobacter pasteurianus subsp. pasteurianus]
MGRLFCWISMALTAVPLPSLWNVPVANGVPKLAAYAVEGAEAVASVTAGTLLQDYLVSDAASHWGIFDASKNRVLAAAHVISLDGQSSYRISDAPLEEGAFSSYNKVTAPSIYRILVICDGSEIGGGGLSDLVSMYSIGNFKNALTGSGDMYVRKDFLDTLEALEQDTNLYSVATPEKVYRNVNILGSRWSRSSRGGITMPAVEIALQTVRLTATSSFSNAHEPQGQPLQTNGVVQPSSSEISDAFMKNIMDGAT